MNEMGNQPTLNLNYQLDMVHYCKHWKVLSIALMEETMVLMLIEVLVMIRKLVKMEMIAAFDSLMMEVHRSLVLKKRRNIFKRQ